MSVTMFRKQHPAAGARPGTLQIAADSPQTRVRALVYSTDSVVDVEIEDVAHIDQ